MKHMTRTFIALAMMTTAQAAEKTFSEFTAATTFDTGGLVLINNGSGIRKITRANFATSLGAELSLSTTYEAKDATLTALAGLSSGSGYVPYFTGTDTASQFATTSFGRGLVNSADAAAVISTLGLASIYQPVDATLTALAGLSTSSGKVVYATGSDTFSSVDSTSYGRGLLNVADAAALRTALDLGSTYQPLDSDLTWLAANLNSTGPGVTANYTYTGDPSTGNSWALTSQGSVVSSGSNVNTLWQFFDNGKQSVKVHDNGFTGYGECRVQWPITDGANYLLSVHGATGVVPVVPALSGNGSKVLALNSGATDFEWIAAGGLPTQTGNNGKFLTTDGSAASWSAVSLTAGVSGTLPVANGGTGIGSLGSNVATWLGTPSSSNLALALTDETGTGAAVFADSPSLTTKATITRNSQGTTPAAGLTITNTTAASSGAQQDSPWFVLTGQGWKTTATAASQAVALGLKVRPVQGSTAPTGKATFGYDINGTGTFTEVLGINSVLAAGGTLGTPTIGNPALTAGMNFFNDQTFIVAGSAAVLNVSNSRGVEIMNSLPLAFSRSAAANTGDTYLASEAAGIVQHGIDAGTVVRQGLKAADGSGTDKAGASYDFAGGLSTGAARGGDVVVHTGMTGASTGSSANTYTTRAFYRAGAVTLTESTATLISNVACASGKIGGGTLTVTVNADDGTDFQALTSTLTFAVVNKAGTVTATITQVDGTTAASSGTLSATYTIVANGNTADIKCNAASSLTQTTLAARVVFDAINSNSPDTTLTSGSIVTP